MKIKIPIFSSFLFVFEVPNQRLYPFIPTVKVNFIPAILFFHKENIRILKQPLSTPIKFQTRKPNFHTAPLFKGESISLHSTEGTTEKAALSPIEVNLYIKLNYEQKNGNCKFWQDGRKRRTIQRIRFFKEPNNTSELC